MKITTLRLVSLFLGVSIAFFTTTVSAQGCVQWQDSVFKPTPNSQGKLAADTGIYWLKSTDYGLKEQAKKAFDSRQNTKLSRQVYLQKLKHQGFFDPAKPTIIFIHGWQPGTITSTQQKRVDLCYQYKKSNGEMSRQYNTLNEWKGWNVGVFYWNQLADEPNVIDAEAKIYSTKGTHNMRWAYIDSTGQQQYCGKRQADCVQPTENVTQMAFDAYKNAFSGVNSRQQKSIRISGQSLGTQIAIQLTDEVLRDTTNDLPKPTRLALMDPYFSPDGMESKLEHLPASVAKYNREKVEDILSKQQNFPIAVYRTSKISFKPFGNPAPKLMSEVTYLRLYPKYLGSKSNVQAKHISSIYLYFMSMQSAPIWPKSTIPSVDDYVNAASSDAQVNALKGLSRYQQPSIGEYHFAYTNFDKFSNIDPEANQLSKK